MVRRYRPPKPDATQLAFSKRFRKVSNRYLRRVAEAYDRDLARALAATDDEVRAAVRDWETARGLTPRDWQAIGEYERDERDEAPTDDVR